MSHLAGNTAMPDGGRLLQVAFDGVERVRPGHWFHLTLDKQMLSLPVLDASVRENWLAFHAPPSAAAGVGNLAYGTACTLDGPQGRAIEPAPEGRRLVLLADTAGLSAVLFAARLAGAGDLALDMALVQLTGMPAVRLRPSRFVLPAMPPGSIAGLGPLEDAGIPSRIAHPEGPPGCYDGDLPTLLEHWLQQRDAESRWHDAVTVIGTGEFANRIAGLLKGKVGQYTTLVIPG